MHNLWCVTLRCVTLVTRPTSWCPPPRPPAPAAAPSSSQPGSFASPWARAAWRGRGRGLGRALRAPYRTLRGGAGRERADVPPATTRHYYLASMQRPHTSHRGWSLLPGQSMRPARVCVAEWPGRERKGDGNKHDQWMIHAVASWVLGHVARVQLGNMCTSWCG